MSDWIIEAENLGKRYRVGQNENSASYALLSEMLTERAKRLFRISRQPQTDHREFWALKDVSFKIKPGEVVGFIGRNGAGKSTLLKLLSRITTPTSGRIRLRGNIASLLEVGTGFNPELTGRENIYLNGVILGMTKKEIDRKLDAIVDFAGVGRFLDTPIKRYSSGMQVRLAFAVAAHLEPEILVIDEVLAVGDAAFQRKCLGKMQDVSTQGRTIIFVSHDLATLQKLCPRSILLESGRCIADGPTPEIISTYLNGILNSTSTDLTARTDRSGEGLVRFTKIELLGEDGREKVLFPSGKPLRIRLHYHSDLNQPLIKCRVNVGIYGWGKIYIVVSTELHSEYLITLPPRGSIDCVIDELPLSQGEYYIGPYFEMNNVAQDMFDAATTLSVGSGNFFGTGKDYAPGWEGKTVLVKHRWDIQENSALVQAG